VRHEDGTDGQAVDEHGLFGANLHELEHRREVVGKAGEVRPGDLVEEVVLHRRHDFRDRIDAQREPGGAEVVVDEERQRAGVVEVRVGDEDVLDLLLVAQGERA
jgi:hypothetical protein